MNQIIFNSYKDNLKNDMKNIDPIKYRHKHKFFFKILFILSIFLFLFLLFFYSFYRYNLNREASLSNKLKDTFKITTLYGSSYTASKINNNNLSDNSIIGIIKIEKLNIEYPIFNSFSDELLKIAPCKFHGPLPNQIGNLCIAGHNYDNNKFFSKIHTLSKDDVILITDLNNKTLKYYIYEISEVSTSNISPINQLTNGEKEITLITCNNKTDTRLIIKALNK